MTEPLMRAERFTWISSYPKSGNTFLRMLLQAYRSNGYVDINEVTSSVGDNTSFWFQNISPLPLDKLTFAARLWLRPAALFNQLNSVNTKVRFIKTHMANAAVNNLPHMIPADLTERAIYIVRDPRDVVSSLQTYMATEKGLSIAEAATNMANPEYCIQNADELPQVLMSWSKHVESWMNEKRYPVAVVKYEDLCDNTESEFSQVLEFCGIDVDEDRVAAAAQACRIEKLHHQERAIGFREDVREKRPKAFFHKGGTRWRDELEPEIAKRIEADHGEVMRRLGYLDADVISLGAIP